MMKKITLLIVVLLISFITIQGQNWVQIGADINGEDIYDSSGGAVSISSDGSIVAIGAYGNEANGTNAGHVRIYQNISGTWTQIGDDIDGEDAYDGSGASVSLSSDGSVVAIGAYRNNGTGTQTGHVRIYQNISGTWTQVGDDIDGEADYDWSGASISLNSDGSVVAIGAEENDGNGYKSGHVRIYQNISGTWTQVGADIDGESPEDQSGASVSLSADGSIVAIGAHVNAGNGLLSGHVRIYENISGTWTQVGLDIDGEAAEDRSGYSLSLNSDGSIVAIGAYYNDGSGTNAGQVRIYQNISGAWVQVGLDIDGEAEEDKSGLSLSINSDGSVVAIGAVQNDDSGTNAGHVRIYQNISGTWTQVGLDIDGEAEEDRSGIVSLSSDGLTVAIGASQNDENGEGSGHVRVYKLRQAPAITNQPEAQINTCLGANIYITLSGFEIDNYQWQVDTGSGFVSIVNSGIYDNAQTATLNIIGVTLSMNNYQYRCYVSNPLGNDTSISVILTTDNENPTISCIGNQTVDATQFHIYVVDGNEFDPIAYNDNCNIVSVENNFNNQPTLANAQLPEGINTITWTIIDTSGNYETCAYSIIVNVYVGIEIIEQKEISIHPNPASSNIKILANGIDVTSFQILDISGKICLTNNVETGNIINVSSLESGVYFIKFDIGSKKEIVKFIKQ